MNKPTVGERHRAEKTNFRVGHRFDRTGRDFVAEDVGHARVVAAAVQVASVLGEHKAFRHGLPESVFGKRPEVVVQNLLQLPHAQELVAVDLRHRGRQQPPIRRNVEIVRDNAVWERVNLVIEVVGGRHANQRRKGIVMSYADQRAVDRVEDDLADPPVLDQRSLLAGLDVHRHEIAERKETLVVVRIEKGPAVGIPGERRHLVGHGPRNVGDPPDTAVARVHCADVLDDARIAKAAIENAGRLVVVRARHRPRYRPRQSLVRRDRIFAHLGEVLPLELVLEFDPVLPGLIQRYAK